MSSMRPVRRSSTAESCITTSGRGETMMSEMRAGDGILARQVLQHRRERHEDLVVVGTAVVAVLVLLADLADHGVGQAVDGERLAEDVPLAEQLIGHVVADERDARDP